MNQGKLRTTQTRRFCAFALNHFLISVVSAPLGLLLFVGWAELLETTEAAWWIAIAFDICLMLAYALAGAWVARRQRWEPPRSIWAALWSLVAPMLVAWAWEALVLVGADLEWVTVSYYALMVAVPLAFPSFLFVLLGLMGGIWWGEGGWEFYLMAFLAGGLPPLLFWLGSLWGAKNRREGEDGTKKDPSLPQKREEGS